MSGLLTQTITILRRSETDTDGVDGTETTFAALASVAASVQPAKQDEVSADRDTSIADVNVWIRPGLEIDAHDRFSYQGVVYELVGPPAAWFGLTGADLVQLAGRRVEG